LKGIRIRIGVTKLYSEDPELEKMITEFQGLVQQFDDVLKDLEWRKPDVEAEEAKLKDLMARVKKDPMVDAASQAIVVRVLRGVLDDKIAEAERLEARITELEKQIRARQGAAAKPGKRGKRGEALH